MTHMIFIDWDYQSRRCTNSADDTSPPSCVTADISHNDATTWNRFWHYWPFVRGIQRPQPVRRPVIWSFNAASMLTWTSCWTNSGWQFDMPWCLCDVNVICSVNGSSASCSCSSVIFMKSVFVLNFKVIIVIYKVILIILSIECFSQQQYNVFL